MPKGSKADRARRAGAFILGILKQPLYELAEEPDADEGYCQMMEAQANEQYVNENPKGENHGGNAQGKSEKSEDSREKRPSEEKEENIN